MELYDVMRTTFAARDFTDDPVTDAQLRRILDNARFAPSGGNRQGWHVVVVRDPKTRAALKPLIRPTLQRYVAQMGRGEAPFNPINPTALTPEEIAATPIPESMIDKLTGAPALLMVFVDLAQVAAFDADAEHVGVIAGASIYPFVWNILLAARNEGLGGTPTTFVGARSPAVKELLNVPASLAFAAMIPIGKPVKQLTKLKRKAVDEFAVRERFGGAPLGNTSAATDGT